MVSGALARLHQRFESCLARSCRSTSCCSVCTHIAQFWGSGELRLESTRFSCRIQMRFVATSSASSTQGSNSDFIMYFVRTSDGHWEGFQGCELR